MAVPAGMTYQQALAMYGSPANFPMSAEEIAAANLSASTTGIARPEFNNPPAPIANTQHTLDTSGNPADPFAGYQWPGTGTGVLTLRGPGGALETVDASNYQRADQLTRSGWRPLNEQGQPYEVKSHQGGQLFYNPATKEWMPINVMLGGEWLPQQFAEMPNFYRTLGSGWDLNTGQKVNPYGTTNPLDPGGNEIGPAGVPELNLGAMPEVSATMPAGARDDYFNAMNALAGQVEQQYTKFPVPTAASAQLDTTLVPQQAERLLEISPEIQQMLAGQGYDPATLAQMRARATEDISGAGLSEMSQARRALEQAGLSESPAAAGVAGDVARRSGEQQTAALRDIDIENALQGVRNKQFGIGAATTIGLSNMEQANQTALANANRLFAALNQNLANQQQTNMAQFGANVGRESERAGAVSNVLGQQGAQWQGAAAQRAGNADQFNTGNQFNWRLNQAQFDRQRALENQRAQEARWHTAYTTTAGFAPNVSGYGIPQGGFSPLGTVLGATGQGVLNQGLENWGRT